MKTSTVCLLQNKKSLKTYRTFNIKISELYYRLTAKYKYLNAPAMSIKPNTPTGKVH